MKSVLDGPKLTMTAGGAITKGTFVGFNSQTCGANAKAVGVADDTVASGEDLAVNCGKVVKVLSGGAITLGDALVSDASGKAVTATAFSVSVPSGATPVTSSGAQPNLTEAGSVLPQAINGYALDAASGADEWIRIAQV